MPRMPRKLFLAVSMIVTLSVVLGACGATPAPAEQIVKEVEVKETVIVPGTPEVVEKEVTTVVEVEKVVVATPTPTSLTVGPTGELIAVRADEPPTLDWKDMVSEPHNWSCSGVMEALTDNDPRSKDVTPVLAESWEWDEDNTWIFKLRQGVTFHNGEPFSAEAVIFSFDRMSDPETSNLASHLNNIASYTAVDDFTLEIITKEPDPIFPARLQSLNIGPPKWTKENPDLVSTALIGTGPYKFVEFKKGQHIKLTANEDYWGEIPKIKDITILFRAEPAVRAAMVQTGEANLAWAINPEDIPNVPKVVQYADLSTILMRPDCTGQHPALADQRVRQAMLYAIDGKMVAETIFKDTAIQVKGNQQVPPAALGYDPTMELWPYDPDKARSLLSEAQTDGIPIDTPITIVERGKGWFAHDNEFAEYAANAWNEIGLNVTLEVIDASAWVDLLFAVKPEQEHADLLYTLHSVELMDYSHSADRMLHSDARYSLWQDEKTDEMLRAAAKLSGDARIQAYQEVARYLEDRVPLLVFGSTLQTHGTDANLQWEPRADGIPAFWEMFFSD